MNNGRYYILSGVIIIAQMVLANYLNLSVFITLSFLPAIILFAPKSIRTVPLMVLAFVFGLFYNFFADGMLGLSSASLLPVAMLRIPVVKLSFGGDLVSRRESISLRRHGLGKPLFALILCNLIYFSFFVPLESAGTREPAFLFIKIMLSTIVSSLVSLIVVNVLDQHA